MADCNCSCFGKNYIGIRGMPDKTPSSGIWLDVVIKQDALKLAAECVDTAHVSAQLFLERLEEFTIKRVWVDIKNKLVNHFAFNKVIDRARVGGRSNTNFLAVIPAEVGVKIQSREYYSGRELDRYVKLFIKTVDIRVKNEVLQKDVTITDGCNTKTICVDLKPNCKNLLRFDFEMQSDEATILLDASDVELASSAHNNSHLHLNSWDGYCYGCDNLNSGCGCGNSYFRAVGVNNGVETGEKHGMLVTMQAECDDTDYLCSLKGQMGLLVAYAMGVELLEAAKGSHRRTEMLNQGDEENTFTLVQLDGGIYTTGGGFATLAKDGKYTKLLVEFVNALKEDLRDEYSPCVTCKQVRKLVHIN